MKKFIIIGVLTISFLLAMGEQPTTKKAKMIQKQVVYTKVIDAYGRADKLYFTKYFEDYKKLAHEYFKYYPDKNKKREKIEFDLIRLSYKYNSDIKELLANFKRDYPDDYITYSEITFFEGVVLYKDGNLLASKDKFLGIKRDSKYYYNSQDFLITIYNSEGDKKSVLKIYEDYISSGYKNNTKARSMYYYKAAELYETLGNKAKAKKYYKKVIDLKRVAFPIKEKAQQKVNSL